VSQEFGNQGNSFGLILWGSAIKRKSLFIVFLFGDFPHSVFGGNLTVDESLKNGII